METLEVERDARGVVTVTLSRPKVHNALSAQMMDEVAEVARRAAGDGTRAMVLTGAGTSFCAGGDLGWMQASAALSVEENAADAMALSDLLDTLDTFPCPTVARVNGAAIGGGAGLVACCDIAIASERAVFALPEVRLGFPPSTIGPYVVRAIGARAARRHLLTGERFDALEAYRIGLVHDVCSADNLDHRIGERVEALLAGGREALTATKRLIADVVDRPFDETSRREAAGRLAEMRTGEEARRRLDAFVEKRSSRRRGPR